MDINEYQEAAISTAIYPNQGNNFIYPTLGLVGESGEIAEKAKKVIRDDGGVLSPEKKEEMKKELGDVMWYLASLSRELGYNLNEVAEANIAKLKSRQERNKLKGSGDNR